MHRQIGFKVNSFCCENLEFGVYYVKQELEELGRFISRKYSQDEEALSNIVPKARRLGRHLLKVSRKTSSDLLSKTDSELIQNVSDFQNTYRQFLLYLVYPHAIESYLTRKVQEALKQSGRPDLQEQLIIPTCGTGETFDFLKTAHSLENASWNAKDLCRLAILKRKYESMPLWDITSKPLSLNYFKDAICALLDKYNHIERELVRFRIREKRIKSSFSKALNNSGISIKDRKLVCILQEFIFLRTFRKDIISKTHFIHRPLLEEIGRRLDTQDEIFYLSYDEIKEFLRTKDASYLNEASRRREAWCVLAFGRNITFLSGRKNIETKMKAAGININTSTRAGTKIYGQTACKGKRIGIACIVKTRREMKKVKSGNILVTPMTTPDYLVILGKVRAIVTDEGGITCHASIISRELGIPCIIGTQIATKRIQDGDRVEVNANKGCVIIKNE
ncbi:hypothetical protein KJ918_06685 [Patescibacteria group bacterium]|nr:hypothetical protein [Patescibacteria group bacterium]